MEELKEYAKKNLIPIVRDKTAEKLSNLVKQEKPKRILEIGTAIGFSAILLLKSCDGNITTIEKNAERFNQAKKNIEKYNLSSRATLVLGDALESLKILAEKKERFDFIFLDGPKGQYINYYPYLKEMLSGGGILFTDNIDLLGLIDSPEKVCHKNRAMVNHMKKYLETLENDKSFKTEFYHIDDGFSISKKIAD